MTRDQFVAKYRYRWGGMVLYGLTDDPAATALTRTQRLMQAPVEIDKLLAAMYDELRTEIVAELQAAALPTNGQTRQAHGPAKPNPGSK